MGVPAMPTATTTVDECHETRLHSLKPMTVLPEQYTARCQALTLLKRIDSIQVKEAIKRDGHRYYVIEMYFKQSHSHIPTLNKTTTPHTLTSQSPDARVERRLSEISNLRNEMYYFAHNGHGSMPCEFCREIVHYVLHGNAKPRRVLGLFDTKQDIHATLTQFLTEILQSTIKVKGYGNPCQGQENIPTLLSRFLFPNEVLVETSE